jgi:hypothetical protein
MPHYSGEIVQDCLRVRATELHKAADNLPHGDERTGLMHKARRMENASLVIGRWGSTPGPNAPK